MHSYEEDRAHAHVHADRHTQGEGDGMFQKPCTTHEAHFRKTRTNFLKNPGGISEKVFQVLCGI